MLNLLNTIVLFGKEFNWPLENALFWLLIAQVALILFIVIVFAVLIKRVGKSEVVVDTKPEERSLQGITLDTSMAQRNFAVGEDFNCDGLAVTANYNRDPVSEPVHVIAVITHEQYDSLQKSGEVEECYIVKPDTSKGGKIANRQLSREAGDVLCRRRAAAGAAKRLHRHRCRGASACCGAYSHRAYA